MESLNNEHIWDKCFVHCSDVVPSLEVERYGQYVCDNRQGANCLLFVHCGEVVHSSEKRFHCSRKHTRHSPSSPPRRAGVVCVRPLCQRATMPWTTSRTVWTTSMRPQHTGVRPVAATSLDQPWWVTSQSLLSLVEHMLCMDVFESMKS